jgi:hypothetical protein
MFDLHVIYNMIDYWVRVVDLLVVLTSLVESHHENSFRGRPSVCKPSTYSYVAGVYIVPRGLEIKILVTLLCHVFQKCRELMPKFLVLFLVCAVVQDVFPSSLNINIIQVVHGGNYQRSFFLYWFCKSEGISTPVSLKNQPRAQTQHCWQSLSVITRLIHNESLFPDSASARTFLVYRSFYCIICSTYFCTMFYFNFVRFQRWIPTAALHGSATQETLRSGTYGWMCFVRRSMW